VVLVWFHQMVDVRSFGLLFVAGVLMLATYVATSVLYVFASDSRLDLMAFVRRKLRALRAPAPEVSSQ